MTSNEIIEETVAIALPETPEKMTPERLEELSKELGFLDLCQLLLELSKRMTMNISWKHPAGVKVSIQQPRKPTGAKKKASLARRQAYEEARQAEPAKKKASRKPPLATGRQT